MIKQKTGDCLGKDGQYTFCGAEDVPIVTSRGHCMYCSAKHKAQLKKDKEKESGTNTNTYNKPKKKKTGELAMFLEIWNERPHVCEHCGKQLFAFKVHYFDHIKPKGSYPELRLDKNNIMLLCYYWDDDHGWYGCHHIKTHVGKEEFNKRKGLYL